MTHKELKKIGWDEWLGMNNPEQYTDNQLEILESAYDYGWYNAYGLESDDRRHKEMMDELKQLARKLAE